MLHAAILVPITPTTGFSLHLLQQLIKTKQRQGSTFLHRIPHSTGNGGAAAVDVSGYWSGASLGHLPFFLKRAVFPPPWTLLQPVASR